MRLNANIKFCLIKQFPRLNWFQQHIHLYVFQRIWEIIYDLFSHQQKQNTQHVSGGMILSPSAMNIIHKVINNKQIMLPNCLIQRIVNFHMKLLIWKRSDKWWKLIKINHHKNATQIAYFKLHLMGKNCLYVNVFYP